jgi:RNA polymerase sigma-70 factor, ECF subfamily
MRLRTRHRRPEQSIEQLLPAFAEDGHHAETVVSWAESGERALAQNEIRRLVRAAIAELPETYRAALLMRDIEGLSTREAADLVGISENALKLRLHRARQALAIVIKRRLVTPAPVIEPATATRSVTAPRRATKVWTGRSAGPAEVVAIR